MDPTRVRILWIPPDHMNPPVIDPADVGREPEGVEYRFSSEAEARAFELAIDETVGWADHLILEDEDEDGDLKVVTVSAAD